MHSQLKWPPENTRMFQAIICTGVQLRADIQCLCGTQIRFARFGRKKLPFYRLVAIDSRKHREGKPLEVCDCCFTSALCAHICASCAHGGPLFTRRAAALLPLSPWVVSLSPQLQPVWRGPAGDWAGVIQSDMADIHLASMRCFQPCCLELAGCGRETYYGNRKAVFWVGMAHQTADLGPQVS